MTLYQALELELLINQRHAKIMELMYDQDYLNNSREYQSICKAIHTCKQTLAELNFNL